MKLFFCHSEKKNRSFTRLIALGLVIFGLTLSVNAQAQEQQNSNAPATGFRQGPPRMPTMTPDKRAARMAKELNLTDEQKAQLQALFEKEKAQMEQKKTEMEQQRGQMQQQKAEMDKQRQEMKKQREEMRAQMDEARKAEDAEIRKIVGEEKFKQLVEKREAQKQKMENFMKQRENNQQGNVPQ